VLGLEPGQPDWRILIVEDQPENNLLLSRLLEDAGFQVCTAANGLEGIDRFQQWRPHFIWMDRRMPVMDGLEATRRIRALPGGEAVKIVALTASVFAEQRGEMLAAGMDDILHKPFQPRQRFLLAWGGFWGCATSIGRAIRSNPGNLRRHCIRQR
jgi:CheY-like chemotaxis protein